MKIDVLKNLSKLTEKRLCQRPFFIKLQVAASDLTQTRK